MICVFEKSFSELCSRLNVERKWAETIFLNKLNLISPVDFLFELIKKSMPESADIEHTRSIVKYSLRSCYGREIYDRCDFFFYMAEKFAQTSNNNVFIVQFDIKSCFNLAQLIPSEDVFKIHNFILGESFKFLKHYCDFAYAFDATRNDDCYFVVGGNVTQDKLVELLQKLQTSLHNSIIKDIQSNDLYLDKPIVTYGFVKIGQGLPIKKSLTDIENLHQQSNSLQKTTQILKKSIYDYKSYYVHKDPYTSLESAILKEVYFMPDDYSNTKKERLLVEKINKKQAKGVFVHFKFQNSSGVNKLLISKEYGIIILKHYINILKNMLSEESCFSDIYFVGLNSFILHFHDVKTIEYATIFFNKFNAAVDNQINNKFINEYFSLTEKHGLDANIKIGNIPSKRGLNSGISTINYLYSLAKNITSVQDLIRFKEMALNINQINIHDNRIASM